MLDGQEIANPAGWLALVTFRRAIEEHRARGRAHRGGVSRGGIHERDGGSAPRTPAAPEVGAGGERDFAAELDDRMRLRQLFEALRGRLSAREQQAAALCYLQGLSRSAAAARMGVSKARMRKLMEGTGPGRPGVAGKVGALVETIRRGGWCEEQGSLMRGLAYGILDPDGERYRLATIHSSECPACRAYVVSLRGLAAVLLPFRRFYTGRLAPALAWEPAAPRLRERARARRWGRRRRLGRGRRDGLASARVRSPGSGVGGAAIGVGCCRRGSRRRGLAAGRGPGGRKARRGCLLALGVGAGCVALTEHPRPARSPVRGRADSGRGDRSAGAGGAGPYGRLARRPAKARLAGTSRSAGCLGSRVGRRAGSAGGASRSSGRARRRPLIATSAALPIARLGRRPAAGPASSAGGTTRPRRSQMDGRPRGRRPTAPAGRVAGASAAQREFGIG